MVALLPMTPPVVLLCLKCGVRVRIDETTVEETTVDVAEYMRQAAAARRPLEDGKGRGDGRGRDDGKDRDDDERED